MTSPDPTGQNHGSQWPKGVSGNVAGRPKGSRNRVLAALDRIGDDAAQDVLAAAVTAAKAGDLAAVSLILSRVWPARKDRPVTFDLPEMRTARDLSAALGAVTASVAGGEITPAEGQAIAGMLEVQRRAIETADLEARVIALEATRGNNS